ncbi:MAG TPA: cytidine/deoxycytidylate deaminase family protein [archaeon]|nr:cytidine/deoxycytidylate deaminase family protein [archaeon]
MARPSWDEYFIDLTRTVANRATCDRGKSGCVIVKDKRILSTGYVGSPPGQPHCDDVGHQMKKTFDEEGNVTNHCTRTIHAEQNAIVQAAKFGTSIEGATIYTKMEPCSTCAKIIVGSGIKRVVCEKRYHAAKETRDMFKDANIDLVVLNDEVENYKNQ